MVEEQIPFASCMLQTIIIVEEYSVRFAYASNDNHGRRIDSVRFAPE
ncbi:MAG: hypothetical protein H3C31_12840 [Brumimicrobium sp.]|nr:hypothetical protein [Brumimicrobium sp.]